MKEQSHEKFICSLILNEDDKVDIEIGISDNIDKLCNELKEKYNFTKAIKSKLKKYIEKFLSDQISNKKTEEIRKRHINKSIIDRLYYKSIESERNRINCLSELKEKELMKNVEEQWFTPKISFYPKNSEREYYKIEDKLLKAGQISKEKRLIKKIEEEIKARDKIDHEKKKNLNLLSKTSRDYQNKIKSQTIKNNIQIIPNEGLNDNNNHIDENPTTGAKLDTVKDKTFSMMINNGEDENKNFSLSEAFKREKSGKKYSSIHKQRYLKGNNNNPISTSQNLENREILQTTNNANNSSILVKNPQKSNNTSQINNISYQSKPLEKQNLNLTNTSFVTQKFKENTSVIAGRLQQENIKSLNNSILNINSFISTNINNKETLVKDSTKDPLKDPNNTTINDIHSNNSQKLGIKRSKSIDKMGFKVISPTNEIILENIQTSSSPSTSELKSNKKIHKNKLGIEFSKHNIVNSDCHSKDEQFANSPKLPQSNKINKSEINTSNSTIKPSFIYHTKNKFSNLPSKTNLSNMNQNKSAKKKKESTNNSIIIMKKHEINRQKNKNKSLPISNSHGKLNHEPKKESTNEFLTRISSSKKLTTLRKSLKKEPLSKRTLSISSSFNHLSNNKKEELEVKKPRDNLKRGTLKLNFLLEIQSKIKGTPLEENMKILKEFKNRIIHSNHKKSKPVPNKNKDSKDRVTQNLINNLQNIESSEKAFKKVFSNKLKKNIDRFKIEKLKEIYEIVYTYCDNIDELDVITEHGISESIKNNLVSPTCMIMRDKGLEFNFQNFSLVANELMKIFT